MTGRSASETATRLLERLAYQVNHTVHSADAESVHDLRVAIRRFAQALAVQKAAFPGRGIKKIRRNLKELMELTSPARDCDVALKLLGNRKTAQTPPKLETAIRARRREQTRLFIPVLRRWGARETSAKWRTVLLPNGSSQTEFDFQTETPRLLKRWLKRGAKAESAEELHQLRIDGKKLRYTVELLEDSHWTPCLEQLAQIQTLLGNVNDSRAVRKLVEDLGGDAEIERWLKRRQKKKTREFHAGWPAVEASLKATLLAPRRKPVGRSTAARNAVALHA